MAMNQMRADVATRLSSALRTSPEETLKAVAGLEALVDDTISRVEAKADASRKAGMMIPLIACKPGCDYCCQSRVVASVPEVLRIVAFLRRKLNEEERFAFIARAKVHLAQFEALTALERSTRMTPCPFLNNERRCSIYAVRPLACRRHHSLDVEACKKAVSDPAATGVPQILEEALLTQPVVEGIHLAVRSAGLHSRYVELIAGVMLALETDAESRWRAGEDAFASAEDAELLQLSVQRRQPGG